MKSQFEVSQHNLLNSKNGSMKQFKMREVFEQSLAAESEKMEE